jgi:hypothetical protein
MKIANFLTKNIGAGNFAFKLRTKRAERIKFLITECYKENKEVNIIDIGGTKEYWNIIPSQFLIENNVHITLVNLPSVIASPANEELFSFCIGDGCDLSEFEDNSFHIAHSNSVIEHVGKRENVVNFSKEIKRVSKKYYYLQTPNYWFPIEPHFMTPFFQWLPKSIRILLISHMDLGWFKKAKNYIDAKETVESCNLLSRKELVKLFPESSLYKERIAFLTKSLIIIGNSLQ